MRHFGISAPRGEQGFAERGCERARGLNRRGERPPDRLCEPERSHRAEQDDNGGVDGGGSIRDDDEPLSARREPAAGQQLARLEPTHIHADVAGSAPNFPDPSPSWAPPPLPSRASSLAWLDPLRAQQSSARQLKRGAHEARRAGKFSLRALSQPRELGAFSSHTETEIGNDSRAFSY